MKPISRQQMKIVIRSPNWLGDMIMALPAIKALSQKLQPQKLTVITRKGFGAVFSRQPFVDEAVECDRSDEAALHSALAEKSYDALYLFTNSFRSAWNGLKTGCRVRVGYGGNLRGWLLTKTLDKKTGLHMIDYYMGIAHSEGASDASKDAQFPLTATEKTFADDFDIADGAIGIPLGARYGPAKRWPDESVMEFVQTVMEKTDRSVYLFGTAQESGQAAEIARENGRVKNLAGKTTVGEMAAVMDRCDWIVANDSGPLHVAAALKKKCIAIFGPTDPNLTAPLADCVTIVREKPDCAPCHKRLCITDHICMKAITARKVLDVIQSG